MVLPYSNLQLKHQNPGAEKPLILPIHVICNTSDEAIHENIRINTRRSNRVLKAQPAHDRVAVLCGSGPSLKDSLELIRRWTFERADVFAMNGAASYLAANGITPEYQVIIDAREETAQLVGPARDHLFASQVHPKCFEKMPSALVWNLQIDGIDDLMPDGYPEHFQVGGAASVGNTALCLAYAMGYRRLEIYGYDSSHRNGKGHAFHQAMNDGDPCALVTFCGKEYLVSLTMKLQAEKFQKTARELQQLGVTVNVHGDGLLPDMWNAPKEKISEQEKYERMWAIDGYREVAPGEHAVDLFHQLVKEPSTLIDFGCGTGRAGVKLAELGYRVTLVDFADNCRDYQSMTLPFLQWDLTHAIPLKAKYGYCTDVMEHIQTEQVQSVLQTILSAAETCFFQISTQPDQMGALIGQDLHLTVQPWGWWVEAFRQAGAEILWSDDSGDTVQFLVRRVHAIHG